MKNNDNLIALMPVADLLTLIHHAGYTPQSIPELLNRASLPTTLLDDPDSFVDPTQAWNLMSFVGYEINDELYGIGSRKVGAGTTELVLAQAMRSPTLGEAMDAISHGANLVFPDMKMAVTRRLNELHFSMRFSNQSTEVQQIFLELNCLPFHSIFRWFTDSKLKVARFRTARSRPSSATHLLAIFDCDIQFEGEGVDMVYPREVESLPVHHLDLNEWRPGAFQKFNEDLVRHKDSVSSSKLQTYIENALRNGITSQELIASSAAMSVATLRRKLSQERVSFRDLRDKVFSEKCHGYLEAGMTIEDISQRLGYTDASSFRRAFRRVFGHAPAQYRHHRS
ncbi:MAG: AraC family transcriptional regulator ligand-binding domain-containing protein [Pseudomonadota bacterium]